jgi:NAD(P)-dependent dehydrogenase (short-subunit alcohol dehydrogenase family)
MARISITGSADGHGQLAARRLVALGHDVVRHGRNRHQAGGNTAEIAYLTRRRDQLG